MQSNINLFLTLKKISLQSQILNLILIECYQTKKRLRNKYPYLSKNEKIKMLLPSEQIREQVYRQFLAEVTEDMKSRREFISMFDTQGHKIKDLMDIHEDMKVFIISTDETFKGVIGLDDIDTEEYKVNEKRIKTKNALLQACEKWIDRNKVEIDLNEHDFSIATPQINLYRKNEIQK